jgi:hypothetical protein
LIAISTSRPGAPGYFAARARASHGDTTYARLSALKKRWDPDNFFHLNQNIKPA